MKRYSRFFIVDKTSDDEKKTYISEVSGIVFSILIVLSVCVLLPHLFPSVNVYADINKIAQMFLTDVSEFKPEKYENLCYLVSMLLFPPIILLLNLFFLKYQSRNNINVNRTYNQLYALSTLAILILLWIDLSKSNYFYIRANYLYKNTLEYFILFVLLILFAYQYEFKLNKNIKKTIDHIIKMLFIPASFLLLLMIFLFCTFNVHYAEQMGYQGHFDAFFYSVAQVFAGDALLVDFNNQYGLYPHFLEPLFRVIGLSVLKFTVIMGVLNVFSFLALLFFLKGIIKNQLIFISGVGLILYMHFFISPLLPDIKPDLLEPYFQYYPLRIVFPSLLILISWIYFESHKRILYYVSFVVYSIGILWNLETGLVSLVAWFLVLTFQELLRFDNMKAVLKAITKNYIVGILLFMAVFGLYNFYIYIRYGSFPNFAHYFYYQTFFYSYGLGMLPMALFHPWNMVILIYLIGLSHSAINLIYQRDTVKAKMVFLLSILGAGIFSYYQGRSHDLNLIVVWYPSILLLMIYADDLYTKVKNNISSKRYFVGEIMLLSALLFFVLSSWPSLFDSAKIMYAPIERRLRTSVSKSPNALTRNIDFIKKYSSAGERVLVLSDNAGIYYAESHTGCSVKVPGISEMALRKDYFKIVEYIKNNGNKMDKIFLDTNFPEVSPSHFMLSEVVGKYCRRVAASPDDEMFLFMKM